MAEIKCLKCGSENDVQVEDCYDYEVTDNQILRHYIGQCVKCKTVHFWTEIYEFKEVTDVQIEK